MSTIAYGVLTGSRRKGAIRAKAVGDAPSVSTLLDAMAAIVPGEVLALHAFMLTAATTASTGPNGEPTVAITSPFPLQIGFWAGLVFCVAFYFAGRYKAEPNAWWPGTLWPDWVRVAVPPIAFIAWMMLQNPTAFDAVFPGTDLALRQVVAGIIAVGCSLLAAVLAPPDK